jgi:hypothetical protein
VPGRQADGGGDDIRSSEAHDGEERAVVELSDSVINVAGCCVSLEILLFASVQSTLSSTLASKRGFSGVRDWTSEGDTTDLIIKVFSLGLKTEQLDAFSILGPETPC